MDVLIIEDEHSLRDALLDGLSRAFEGLQVVGTESVEDAERAIENHGWPQVLVSDIRLPGRSGIDLLIDLQARRMRVKTILISAYASSAAVEQVDKGSALRFLPKPFELSELVGCVRMALEHQEFSGNADGITFLDILQILHMGKKSAALILRVDDRVGHIHMEDGEIVHADCGEQEGVEAFNTLVEWQAPAFKVRADPPKAPHTISASFGFLLMESTRLADEARHQSISDAFEPDLPVNGEITSSALVNPRISEIPSDLPHSTLEDPTMSNLKDVCKELVDDTPEAVAANVVDLNTGMMLGGHFVSNFTSDHFEAVSAAVTNLFRGKETLRVEKLVKSQRGDSAQTHFMQQVHLSTTNLEHFVVKVPDREAVLTLVTRRPGNIGMGWAAVRSTAPQLVDIVPS